ncbi:hypothetical protein AR540_05950 [Pseudomonas sp. EpS/L25]|nr:hypothetical protein AR540_05950 [Pseudomonas sp. EpS/L25]
MRPSSPSWCQFYSLGFFVQSLGFVGEVFFAGMLRDGVESGMTGRYERSNQHWAVIEDIVFLSQDGALAPR